MIGLIVCHKASNVLISYGNGSSGIRIGKGFKDIRTYMYIHPINSLAMEIVVQISK